MPPTLLQFNITPTSHSDINSAVVEINGKMSILNDTYAHNSGLEYVHET